MGINPKVKTTVWLEFELTYYHVPVQNISHYTIGILFELLIEFIIVYKDLKPYNCM